MSFLQLAAGGAEGALYRQLCPTVLDTRLTNACSRSGRRRRARRPRTLPDEPGDYVLFCMLADVTGDGLPHLAHGMVADASVG